MWLNGESSVWTLPLPFLGEGEWSKVPLSQGHGVAHCHMPSHPLLCSPLKGKWGKGSWQNHCFFCTFAQVPWGNWEEQQHVEKD